MPGKNLTRDEARERADLLSVATYDVSLDLTTGPTSFRTTTTVRFDATTEGASTFIDLIADSVQAITLNGESLDPATHFDGQEPPQSVSVSSPFATRSAHEGAMQRAPEHALVTQSETTEQVLPTAHDAHDPPQSMSVSVPSLLPLKQVDPASAAGTSAVPSAALSTAASALPLPPAPPASGASGL